MTHTHTHTHTRRARARRARARATLKAVDWFVRENSLKSDVLFFNRNSKPPVWIGSLEITFLVVHIPSHRSLSKDLLMVYGILLLKTLSSQYWTHFKDIYMSIRVYSCYFNRVPCRLAREPFRQWVVLPVGRFALRRFARGLFCQYILGRLALIFIIRTYGCLYSIVDLEELVSIYISWPTDMSLFVFYVVAGILCD